MATDGPPFHDCGRVERDEDEAPSPPRLSLFVGSIKPDRNQKELIR